jgi:hypothetical protein
VAGFCISGVEPSGYATRELISKMGLRDTGCEGGRWMELAQDRVQLRAFVLAVLNLRVLFPAVDIPLKVHSIYNCFSRKL